MKSILLGFVLAVPLLLIGCSDDDSSDSLPHTPSLTSLRVEPQISNLNIGTTERFQAIAVYDDGSIVDVSTRVIWSMDPSGPEIIRPYDPENPVYTYAIAYQVGDNDLIATLDSKEARTKVRVFDSTLDTIIISPSTDVTMVSRESMQFTAMGSYSDGREQDLTDEVQWTATGTTVSVANGGWVYSELPGLGFIGAIFDGVTTPDSVATKVTVIDPSNIVSIAFEAEPTQIFTNNKEGTYLKVIATLGDDTTVDISTAANTTWLSTSDTTASFPFEGNSNKGRIVGHEVGETKVQVTFKVTSHVDLMTEEKTITVSDDIMETIAIELAETTFEQGQRVPFTTILTTSSGGTYDIQDFELHDYTVLDESIVSFGLLKSSELTALKGGTTTVTATYTENNVEKTDSVDVTVSPALP